MSRQGQASDKSTWNVVFATDKIVDLNIFRRGGGCLFPLYLYEAEFGASKRTPNIDQTIIKNFSTQLRLPFKAERSNNERDYFSPDDFWAYIYAILHSQQYRVTFKEFLDLDFPRIPYATDSTAFWGLVELGNDLKNIHLMRIDTGEFTEADINEGTNLVEKIIYKAGAVYINKSQAFRPIDPDIWEMQIGGYQPLEKWLKDRKGQILSETDITHYKKIVGALIRTKGLTCAIDQVIDGILI